MKPSGGSVALLAAALCAGAAAAPFTDPLASGGAGPVMVRLAPEPFPMGWFETATDLSTRGRMGSVHEVPVRTVVIEDLFAMSVDEITVGEFRAFVERTRYVTVAERHGGGRRPVMRRFPKKGCVHYAGSGRRSSRIGSTEFNMEVGFTWRDPGYPATERHPVGCMARADAVAYAEWLARETGRPYRLPSEAEWEYAARAGRSADELRYLVEDNDAKVARLLFLRTGSSLPPGFIETPRPVDADSRNPFGLRGLNTYAQTGWYVAEWTADCWYPDYGGASPTGEPRTDGDCRAGVTRGDLFRPFVGRPPYQLDSDGDASKPTLGFRVVRSPMSGPLVRRGE